MDKDKYKTVHREENRLMLRVIYGSITNAENSFLINNMAIVVDKSMGCVMKYGDVETSDIIDYYTSTVEKLSTINKEMADDLILIKFDRYGGKLSIDEICTIVNYGMNCHSVEFMELFGMEIEVLHERIKKLNEYGY